MNNTQTGGHKFSFPLYDTIKDKINKQPSKKKIKVKDKKKLCLFFKSTDNQLIKEMAYLIIYKYNNDNNKVIDYTHVKNTNNMLYTIVWDAVDIPDDLFIILDVYHDMCNESSNNI